MVQQDENILNGPQSYEDAMHSFKVAWGISVGCFVFDFIGLLCGVSAFSTTMNLSQSVLHFIGGLYTCWFILYSWDYTLYWKICGWFCILPALLEIIVLVKTFLLKTTEY